MSSFEEREAEPCPICYRSRADEEEVSFVFSPSCGHVFCLPCIERLLLAPSTHYSRSSPVSLGITTTLGTCPICRAELSYFDLLVEGSKVPLVAKNDPLDPRLFGAVYTEDGTDGVGWGSYHFPVADKSPHQKQEPRINFEEAPAGPGGKSLRFSHSRYHAASHTWEGKVDMVFRHHNMHWRVILTFSDNFQFVSRGVLIQTKSLIGSDIEDGDEAFSQVASRYCFDGSWLLQSCNDAGVDSSSSYSGRSGAGLCSHWDPLAEREIFVTRGLVHRRGVWYRIMRYGDMLIRIVQAVEPNTTIFTADWDWNKEPQGPTEAGSSLVWNVCSDDQHRQRTPKMVWTREVQAHALAEPLSIMEVIPLGGNSGRTYRRVVDAHYVSSHSAAVFPSHCSDTVWGNTFCQGYKVGLASYHFVKPHSVNDVGLVYISYEHPLVSHWPPLDNGMPIPARVMFRNVSFPDPHSFRGHICWLQDYGTSWQGVVRWEYEMKFDTEFICILSGAVTTFMANDDNDAMPNEMSRYGLDLVYCNAALYDEYCGRQNATDTVQGRLKDEGASEQTRGMILHVSRLARRLEGISADHDPFEYS